MEAELNVNYTCAILGTDMLSYWFTREWNRQQRVIGRHRVGNRGTARVDSLSRSRPACSMHCRTRLVESLDTHALLVLSSRVELPDEYKRSQCVSRMSAQCQVSSELSIIQLIELIGNQGNEIGRPGIW